jgi:triphosphoribosyl-dephospho-CoA synthase
VEAACRLELEASKPGNVSRGRDLPGLSFESMIRSAAAIGRAFSLHRRARVGRLVLEAVRATRRVARTNTNLGIVLLLAPLAKAADRAADIGRRRTRSADPPRPRADAPIRAPRLRTVLRDLLARLDRRDAADVYRAIRIARPGGLGRVDAQDVRRAPTVTLPEAMRLAAGRDAIAAEYVSDYVVTFNLGLPALRRFLRAGASMDAAVAQTFLVVLAARPDTLIRRRHGEAMAHRVSAGALRCLLAGGFFTAAGRRRVTDYDRRLRRHRPRINPGACADLVVATLFVWLIGADDRRWPAEVGGGQGGRTRAPLRGGG